MFSVRGLRELTANLAYYANLVVRIPFPNLGQKGIDVLLIGCSLTLRDSTMLACRQRVQAVPAPATGACYQLVREQVTMISKQSILIR